MQVLGIATEFAVYARYLGAVQWVPTIQRALFFVLPVFVWLIVLQSRHPMIVFGTGSAGLLFLGMSVLYWQRVRQSPELLHVMGATNALLASVLLFKAGAGLSGHAMVPYNANLLNIVLYAVALWVMCVTALVFCCWCSSRQTGHCGKRCSSWRKAKPASANCCAWPRMNFAPRRPWSRHRWIRWRCWTRTYPPRWYAATTISGWPWTE